MTVAGSPASASAQALLEELVALGVGHIVVCPGSRSQALALEAARLEEEGRIRLHVRIDERVAGFTALGIGRETRRPAAVVCTSGTAVANLLPAVLEAHHSGVPLLLLTADRPPELRGVGANQATRQPGMFGEAVRLAVDAETPTGADGELERTRQLAADAVAHATGRSESGAVPGPVHLNLPYREPLAGPVPPCPDAALRARSLRAVAPVMTFVERGPRTVVLAGADAGPAAVALAREGGWPLVAEIVSGARTGDEAVHAYREALGDPALGGRIERVLVLGHPTLSREATRLLSDPAVEVIARRGTGEALDLNGRTRQAGALSPKPGGPAASEDDRAWLAAWRSFSETHRPADAAPDAAAPLDRAALVEEVWRASAPEDRLVFGSSRLVRVADALLPGRPVVVHANRGLAGIDGTIATAFGIAAASQAPAPGEDAPASTGVTRVLLGDLAFLHDVGALLAADVETEPRIQIVVGNDKGGTIFDGLEVAAAAGEAAMTRVQYTPHSARLEQLALAFGWEFRRVSTRSALGRALASTVGHRRIIEVPLTR